MSSGLVQVFCLSDLSIYDRPTLTEGTGGIIALGIFKQKWSPSECKQRFEELTQQAFQHRLGMQVPIVRHIVQFFYSARYESGGIEGALQKAFGSTSDTVLLDSQRDAQNCTKFGVMTTSGDGQERPYLLANYTRDWSTASATGSYYSQVLGRWSMILTWNRL